MVLIGSAIVVASFSAVVLGYYVVKLRASHGWQVTLARRGLLLAFIIALGFRVEHVVTVVEFTLGIIRWLINHVSV